MNQTASFPPQCQGSLKTASPDEETEAAEPCAKGSLLRASGLEPGVILTQAGPANKGHLPSLPSHFLSGH